MSCMSWFNTYLNFYSQFYATDYLKYAFCVVGKSTDDIHKQIMDYN